MDTQCIWAVIKSFHLFLYHFLQSTTSLRGFFYYPEWHRNVWPSEKEGCALGCVGGKRAGARVIAQDQDRAGLSMVEFLALNVMLLHCILVYRAGLAIQFKLLLYQQIYAGWTKYYSQVLSMINNFIILLTHSQSPLSIISNIFSCRIVIYKYQIKDKCTCCLVCYFRPFQMETKQPEQLPLRLVILDIWRPEQLRIFTHSEATGLPVWPRHWAQRLHWDQSLKNNYLLDPVDTHQTNHVLFLFWGSQLKNAKKKVYHHSSFAAMQHAYCHGQSNTQHTLVDYSVMRMA